MSNHLTWLPLHRVLLWKSTRIVWEKQADEATERGGDTGRESRGFMNGASQVEPLGRGKSMWPMSGKEMWVCIPMKGPDKSQNSIQSRRKNLRKKENPKKRRIKKHSIGLIQNNKKIKKEEADAFNHSLQKAKSAEKNTKFEFWQQGLYFDNLNTNYIQNTDYKYWMISNKTPMFLVGLPQPA